MFLNLLSVDKLYSLLHFALWLVLVYFIFGGLNGWRCAMEVPGSCDDDLMRELAAD